MRSATGDTAGRPSWLANWPVVMQAPSESPGSCGWPITSAPSPAA